MKAEPGSFYLGVIDVFSIMLPGALLAYFLPQLLDLGVLGTLLEKPEKEVHDWLAVLFAAYLFGHIIFLVSSFLDKPYDDRIRPCFWPDIDELAYLRAEAIKEKSIGEDNSQAVNTFQWAKSMLVLEHHEASAEVAGLEAASKFFRSMVVVLALLAALNIGSPKGDWLVVLVLLVLMGLSLWRYAERRHKSIKQACWFVITMDGLDRQKAAIEDPAQKPTHAGGVVYRMKGQNVEYLLVRPKTKAKEWLLPKGHIERREGPDEAAVREVREEAGVVADIVSRVGSLQFRAKGENVVAEFYLMKFREQMPAAEDRGVAWCSPSDALNKLSFANTRHLLAVADRQRRAVEKTKQQGWTHRFLMKLQCLLWGTG